MTEGKRIFVTGATGLVGFHVVKHLSGLGHAVVAQVRASSNTAALQELIANTSARNVQLVKCDLSDSAAMSSAISGCDAVVHCAGAVDVNAAKEQIVATNVGGTRNVLQAAIKAGAKHFVHISSLSVITGQEDQFNVDETAPLRYCGEAYADSKVDAEKVVTSESGQLATTILRPGFIYGPGERAWLPRLIANIKAGKAMLIDGGQRSTNVIYVQNLARAVELALFNSKAYGQAYNLTDGSTPTKKELFDAISDGLGLPRVTKSIPRAVAKTACTIVSTIAPFLPADTRQSLSRFSPGAFRLAAVNQGFSVAKAERELAYTNRIPFAQGMAETLKHFGSNATTACTPQTVGTRS